MKTRILWSPVVGMALTLAPGGCAHKAYAGPTLARSQVAHVIGSAIKAMGVLETVDGRCVPTSNPADFLLPGLPPALSVPPGRRELGLRVYWTNGYIERVTVPVHVRAGGIYPVDFYEQRVGQRRADPGGVEFWRRRLFDPAGGVTLLKKSAKRRPAGRVFEVVVREFNGPVAARWSSAAPAAPRPDVPLRDARTASAQAWETRARQTRHIEPAASSSASAIASRPISPPAPTTNRSSR